MKIIIDFFKKPKVINYILITLGCISLAAGFYFFNSPANLVTGGVMGISIILEEALGISSTLSVYILDVACLILGLIFLGKNFFTKTAYATLLIPTVLWLFELCHFDKEFIIGKVSEGNVYLVSFICGAVLTGFGIGIVIRSGGATGGMDVPQKVLSDILRLPFSSIMYLTDGLIILLGIGYFGVESGIFAILSLAVSGYLIDMYSVGGPSKRAAYIITEKPNEIKMEIFKVINRGVTEANVVGGYSGNDKKMLICILHRNEYYRLRNIVNEKDPKAFMFISSTHEVIGEGFSNREEEINHAKTRKNKQEK